MEVYENSIETIYHTIDTGADTYDVVGDPALVVVEQIDTASIQTTIPAVFDQESNRLTATVPPDLTKLSTPKTVRWVYELDINGQSFSVETAEETLEVVRPHITFDEYNRTMPEQDQIEDMNEFKRLERLSRKIIEAYTLQTFQLRRGVEYIINGNRSDSLQLPERLVSLEHIGFADETPQGVVSTPAANLSHMIVFDPASPWQVRKRYEPTSSFSSMSVLGDYHYFRTNSQFVVRGDWGWEHIPESVKQASALLIRDYSDDDALYREKYITIIRAADWRMEFGATGAETTGNANADMMLEKFRNYRPEVI